MTSRQPDDLNKPANNAEVDGSRVLACGARVDDLLEQVADGDGARRSAHQGDCVHCQAALTELSELWTPMLELADEQVTVPVNIRAAIKSQIDRLVQDIWYTLQLTDEGAIRVAARTVAAIARDAAGQVPGVRAALGRTTDAKIAQIVLRATRAHRHPRAAIGVLGRTAVVDIALAVSPGLDLRHVATQVQKQVIRELREGIGLTKVTVNVTVDDIL